MKYLDRAEVQYLSSASSISSFFSEDGVAGAEGLGVDPDPKKETNVFVAPEAEAETVAVGLGALKCEPEDGVVTKGDDDTDGEGATKLKDPALEVVESSELGKRG